MHFVLAIPIGEATLNAAVQDALANAPAGSQGLSDCSVDFKWFSGIIYGRSCFTVRGFPSHSP
ncbi:MAG: hypothetical protein K8S54_17690 [Spirochaetia bacterium]|nr:hypothetical protein [Spirochaetia bacterium]